MPTPAGRWVLESTLLFMTESLGSYDDGPKIDINKVFPLDDCLSNKELERLLIKNPDLVGFYRSARAIRALSELSDEEL